MDRKHLLERIKCNFRLVIENRADNLSFISRLKVGDYIDLSTSDIYLLPSNNHLVTYQDVNNLSVIRLAFNILNNSDSKTLVLRLA